jgi:hypothetical protein
MSVEDMNLARIRELRGASGEVERERTCAYCGRFRNAHPLPKCPTFKQPKGELERCVHCGKFANEHVPLMAWCEAATRFLSVQQVLDKFATPAEVRNAIK